MTNKTHRHADPGCSTLATALFALLCFVTSTPLHAAETANGGESENYWPLPYPEEIMDPTWVDGRRLEQQLEAESYETLHDFSFTDDLIDSGISFQHQIVDDAGKDYKAVHYDHGNGVAVADVDGDGHLDIYFVTQLGGNELWRNKGNGTFDNITDSAGVAVADRVSVSASFADTDNDGDPDLFVTTVRQGNLFFTNDGTGKFTNVSKSSGLDYVGHSSGSTFFDYDRDGLLDVYVANVGVYTINEKGSGDYWIGLPDAFAGQLHPERYESSVIYRNAGNNRFIDVTDELELTDNSWTGDVHPIDRNSDGWMDLYVLDMQGHDEFYENVEGKKFVKKSREFFPETSWGSMGVRIFDFDNDGDMDILVTDMHTDMVDNLEPDNEKSKMPRNYPFNFLNTDGHHVLGNAFFRNNGNGEFSEISSDIGVENFWPWGLSTGDLNADGYEDVFIASSMNYPYRYGINSVLLNEGGKRFVASEYVLGVEPRRDNITAKPWFRIDCSGQDREHRHCENRTGRFEVWGSVGSRSSVIFDLDRDGDLDIVTNDFNSPPMVLRSDLAQKHQIHYLAVSLEGRTSNKSGIGAKIELRAGDSRYTKVNDGKSGYLSQSDMPVYFGLGPNKQVDEIIVTWPSGERQVVEGPIEANRIFQITEPK